ncbi:translesion DNA synthesis-associated protein ImuA [Aliikangiella maris]|uniref:Translesion DNA synthesis-associated protein ImuA n=2 Tax=Aliikangiella maris TaxID=3162458 RepID=A0ABV3MLU6_9GAMM
MSSPIIKQLINSSSVWQASSQSHTCPTLSTGYRVLDQQLHYGGWPQGKLSEILLPHHGVGEIRLLLPLLYRLIQQNAHICWINPPYPLYMPALLQQHIAPEKQIMVQTTQHVDTIWAAQQALASQECSGVFIWLSQQTTNKQLRKLSLATKAGHCWGIVFRQQQFTEQPSPSALRLKLSTSQHQQLIEIIKQPGGWSGQKAKLNLFPEKIYWRALAVNQWPVVTNNSEVKAEVTEQQSIHTTVYKTQKTHKDGHTASDKSATQVIPDSLHTEQHAKQHAEQSALTDTPSPQFRFYH